MKQKDRALPPRGHWQAVKYYTHIAQEERALEEILTDSLKIFYCQWYANALTDVL